MIRIETMIIVGKIIIMNKIMTVIGVTVRTAVISTRMITEVNRIMILVTVVTFITVTFFTL
jgi:hypothetical protein